MMDILNYALYKKQINNASAQPDWLQNNSTANDYIKNRPFYSSTNSVEEIILYGDLDFNDVIDTGMNILNGIRFPKNFNLAEGSTKKFKLTIDDSGTISATEITE